MSTEKWLAGMLSTPKETEDTTPRRHAIPDGPLMPEDHQLRVEAEERVERSFGFSKNDAKEWDCHANAEHDEPMFVLLARDVRAPALVEQWADVSESRGTDPAKVENARECARQMRAWRTTNRPEPEPNDDPELVQTQADIAAVCDEVKALLLAKNRAYGNSALDPVRIFSKAPADEQIKVRIDDKLSRLMRGHAAGEDVILDALGYLMLLRVHTRREARKADAK